MAGYYDVIANAGEALTIGTSACTGTGIRQQEALLIHGCRFGSCPVNSSFQVIFHFIHAGNYQYGLGAKDDCSNTIAHSINIDHLAIHAQTVRTG
jgi:hypothetical protein